MRHQVRLKDNQRHREQSHSQPEHLARRKEDEQRQQQRKAQHRQPRTKDQRIRAIRRPVAVQQLSPIHIGLGLEEAPLQRRHLQRQPQQRHRRQRLHHRRMLRVQPEVLRLPYLVPRKDVVALVPRQRLLPDRRHHRHSQHHQQSRNQPSYLTAPQSRQNHTSNPFFVTPREYPI